MCNTSLKLTELSNGFNINTELAKANIYYYEYDEKKRLILKRVPGKEAEFFVYDEQKTALY
ncbi:MAG: hypothetical protein U5Q03_18150 [Bacteroidota bacterium]|nr:hypothetical protein [Bacteroidota bacterium]